MVRLLFLVLKPILFLMEKNFKNQMKAFIITAIEWLLLQRENDLDDKILSKLKME